MATPKLFTGNNVHVDADLTNFAVGYGGNEFIADKIFPEVPVGKQSDQYPIFGMENYIAEDDVQGDKDTPKEVERTFRRESYFCERHALTEFIPDSWRTNADDAVAMALEDAAVVANLKEKVLLNREIAVMTLLTTTGNYATGLYENLDTIADHNLDDSSGPGALKTLMTFKNTAKGMCGFPIDTMWVSSDAWVYLSTDSAFFGGGSVNVALTPEQLATILKLRQVLVVDSHYSSGNPKRGGAVTLSDLWPGNGIWMGHCPPGITRLQPSLGKIFKWNATAGYQNGEMVRTARDERVGDGGTWIEYKQHYVPKLTALDTSSKIVSGCYLANVYNAL